MTDGSTVPGREEFRRLARAAPLVAVTRRLLADGETPVGVYRKLGGDQRATGGRGSFLLESAEHGRVWARYSFIGVGVRSILTEREGRATWLGGAPFPGQQLTDPLSALRDTMRRLRTPRRTDLPPLTGGLVGYVSYDAVRRLERLPEHAVDDLHLPEIALMLVEDLAVLDHADGSVLLVANVLTGAEGDDPVDRRYDDAICRLDAMSAALAQPTPPSVSTVEPSGSVEVPVTSRTGECGYRAVVERIKEEIRAGEAFQVVLSQRFEVSTTASALDVYRTLRTRNPSPYMYLLQFPDGVGAIDVVGSSPESLVKLEGRHAVMHPIAGTRPRGGTPEEDTRLAAELLADPKERSEHVMLVDLGRNDLGRVCLPGSVDVVDFMDVERYSHVMHLVSTVVGELGPGNEAYDLLTAAFPAGTLSGAPKPRAMELIDELEPTRRGVYGGVIGYFDAGGDLDTAIAIRTALLRDGVAYVQAGAGIVADSDPAAEHRECVNKARAVLEAIAQAGTLRPVRTAP